MVTVTNLTPQVVVSHQSESFKRIAPAKVREDAAVFGLTRVLVVPRLVSDCVDDAPVRSRVEHDGVVHRRKRPDAGGPWDGIHRVRNAFHFGLPAVNLFARDVHRCVTAVHGSNFELCARIRVFAVAVVQSQVDVPLGDVREENKRIVDDLVQRHRQRLLGAVFCSCGVCDRSTGIAERMRRKMRFKRKRLSARHRDFEPARFIRRIIVTRSRAVCQGDGGFFEPTSRGAGDAVLREKNSAFHVRHGVIREQLIHR